MLGYYAHQHGSGHLNYGRLFSEVFKDEMTIFTSLQNEINARCDIVRLADENPDGSTSAKNQIDAPKYLHYSPVGQDSILKRSYQLLREVIDRNIKLLIVDVSAEVAALSRASSIPYAYVKLPGDRDDPAHTEAFRGAVFVLAYYPENFESKNTPEWLRKKTIYLGLITDHTFQNDKSVSSKIENVLVISGAGGNPNLEQSVKQLTRRFADAKINAIGNFESKVEGRNLNYHGYVDNYDHLFQKADVIVANCGLNTVTEIVNSGKPFIVIPEERPYDEQYTTARMLIQEKFAVSLEMAEKLQDVEIIDLNRQGINNQLVTLKHFKDLLQANLENLPAIPKKFRQLNKKNTHVE